MKLKKMVLAAVAASAIAWPFVANAYPDYWAMVAAKNSIISNIESDCTATWGYDPTQYSNWDNCRYTGILAAAQGAQVAASMYLYQYYQTNDPYWYQLYENYDLLFQLLYYWP